MAVPGCYGFYPVPGKWNGFMLLCAKRHFQGGRQSSEVTTLEPTNPAQPVSRKVIYLDIFRRTERREFVPRRYRFVKQNQAFRGGEKTTAPKSQLLSLHPQRSSVRAAFCIPPFAPRVSWLLLAACLPGCLPIGQRGRRGLGGARPLPPPPLSSVPASGEELRLSGSPEPDAHRVLNSCQHVFQLEPQHHAAPGGAAEAGGRRGKDPGFPGSCRASAVLYAECLQRRIAGWSPCRKQSISGAQVLCIALKTDKTRRIPATFLFSANISSLAMSIFLCGQNGVFRHLLV